jgi:hypothetical protein
VDPAHERGRSRPRLAIGEHPSDFVCAQMPRRGDQLFAIRFRELRRKQPDCRQVQIPAAQRLQDLGMASARPGGVDPLVRNAFGELEHPTAVRKHRGATLLEIELPRLDLAQVDEQVRLDRIATPHELAHAREQLDVRYPSEHLRHDSTSGNDGVRSIISITWVFRAHRIALCGVITIPFASSRQRLNNSLAIAMQRVSKAARRQPASEAFPSARICQGVTRILP